MTKLLKLGVCAAAICVTAFSASGAMARRGADDPAGHVRQCRGCDDAPGHMRQGRGADDPVGHVRGGNGADDPADHDANDDHGGDRARASDDSALRQSRGTVADDRGQGRGRGRGRGGDDAPGEDRGGQGRGSDDPS